MQADRQALTRARFDELAVLVAVAEAGSLTRAAKRLGVPKSTVGRAVRRLEDELEVALVQRIARGPALTEQGRMLAEQAAPHVAALRDVAKSSRRDASEVYGLLRVTAPPDVAAFVLAPLLPGFLARHPRIEIELESTLRVVDLVREGCDLAVRVTLGRLPSSTLVARKLAPMGLALYAGVSYAARRELPKRVDELARHDCVLFYPGGKLMLNLTGPEGVVKIALKSRVSGNDLIFLRETIINGLGLTVLPWFLANPELAAGRITRVLPDYQLLGGTAYLVHAPAKPVPAKVAAFAKYLQEHAPRLIVQPF